MSKKKQCLIWTCPHCGWERTGEELRVCTCGYDPRDKSLKVLKMKTEKKTLSHLDYLFYAQENHKLGTFSS
jgi:hypothetical protein